MAGHTPIAHPARSHPTQGKPPALLGRRALAAGAAWMLPAIASISAAPAFAASGCLWRIDLLSTKDRQPVNNGADELDVQVKIDPQQAACVNNTQWPGTEIYLTVTLDARYYTGAFTASGSGWSPLSGTGTLDTAVTPNLYTVVYTLTTGSDAPGQSWNLFVYPKVTSSVANGTKAPANSITVSISGNSTQADYYVSTNNGGSYTHGTYFTY